MGNGMTFEKILSRLGERGEKGESPRQMRQERSPSAGRMEANGEVKGEKFAPFAQRSPSRESAPIKAIRPIRPIRPGTGENAMGESLSDDLRCVASWWEWSPEDLADFKVWARDNHDDAAAWVRQEAVKVRHYVDRLRIANVTYFIRPNLDRSETETSLQPSARKTSCL